MSDCPTGNIGEWSEVYVFFRILGDCVIFPCDKNLKRLTDGHPLPVLAIHRGDAVHEELTYAHAEEGWHIIESDKDSGAIVSARQGAEEADNLLNDMLTVLTTKKSADKGEKAGNKKAHAFPKAWKFLQYVHASSIKAKSLDKKDISLTINDARGAGIMKNGYSIKSFVGGAPTLLNASSRTMFTYEVTGLDASEIASLNSLKIGKLVKAIQDKGGKIHWVGMDEQYMNNLLNVDEGMPRVVAALLLDHFAACDLPAAQRRSTVKAATEHLTEENPLNMGTRYELKVKRFLEATALGMIPSKAWDGTEDANGGYIIVKPEGEIVTLHIYERTLLRDYLYHHTYFEHPSTSRYDCGELHLLEDGRIVFKLPLQIRYSYAEG